LSGKALSEDGIPRSLVRSEPTFTSLAVLAIVRSVSVDIALPKHVLAATLLPALA